LGDDGPALFGIGQITGQPQAAPTGVLDQRRGAGGVVMFVQIGDGHVGALLGEGHRHRTADAGVAAGDQCAFSGQQVAADVVVHLVARSIRHIGGVPRIGDDAVGLSHRSPVFLGVQMDGLLLPQTIRCARLQRRIARRLHGLIGQRIGGRALLLDGIGDRNVIGKNPVVLHDGPNSRPSQRRNHSHCPKCDAEKRLGSESGTRRSSKATPSGRAGLVPEAMLSPLTVTCSAWLSLSTRMVCGSRKSAVAGVAIDLVASPLERTITCVPVSPTG
jgi:hypothetical protein